jgi:hypothetical protein
LAQNATRSATSAGIEAHRLIVAALASTFINGRLEDPGRATRPHHSRQSRGARNDCWIGASSRSGIRSAVGRRVNLAAATLNRVAWPPRCAALQSRCEAADRALSCDSEAPPCSCRHRGPARPRVPSNGSVRPHGGNAMTLRSRKPDWPLGHNPVLRSHFIPSNSPISDCPRPLQA